MLHSIGPLRSTLARSLRVSSTSITRTGSSRSCKRNKRKTPTALRWASFFGFSPSGLRRLFLICTCTSSSTYACKFWCLCTVPCSQMSVRFPRSRDRYHQSACYLQNEGEIAFTRARSFRGNQFLPSAGLTRVQTIECVPTYRKCSAFFFAVEATAIQVHVNDAVDDIFERSR